MKTIKLSEDFVPVSDFKAQAADLLRRLGETGQPIVITQNGKVAGVLLSPAEYDRLTYERRLMAAVEEGLADADAGRTYSRAEVESFLDDRSRTRRRR